MAERVERGGNGATAPKPKPKPKSESKSAKKKPATRLKAALVKDGPRARSAKAAKSAESPRSRVAKRAHETHREKSAVGGVIAAVITAFAEPRTKGEGVNLALAAVPDRTEQQMRNTVGWVLWDAARHGEASLVAKRGLAYAERGRGRDRQFVIAPPAKLAGLMKSGKAAA